MRHMTPASPKNPNRKCRSGRTKGASEIGEERYLRVKVCGADFEVALDVFLDRLAG